MSKSKRKLSLCFFALLIFGFCLGSQEETVTEEIDESTWKIEEDSDQKEIIRIEVLENLEQRAKELEEKKAKEQAELEYEIAQVKEKRKILIECLEQKGVILFSRPDCKPCKQQEAYFGEDFKDLNFVDCEKSKYMCSLLRNIRAYPTWYLGRNLGVKKEGVMDLPTLARFTKCPW